MAQWQVVEGQLLLCCHTRLRITTPTSFRRAATRHQTLLIPYGLGQLRGLFKTRSPLSKIRRVQQTASTRSYSPDTATPRNPGVSQTIEEASPGNSIATITVSNPSKLNIVSSPFLFQLISTCKSLSTLSSLRAVVLTGGAPAPGKKASAFIGGADIKEMHEISASQEARTFITNIHNACQALRDLPVPVIAKINGYCLGAGLEIAAACDLRIATRGSMFGMPEVKVGIPSVVEAALLPSLIGLGRTRRLLYLAETISAEEAERWGLVEKVVADVKDLDSATKDWTEALAGMGPRAIRSQKSLMQKWENLTVEEGIQAGVAAFAEAYEDGGLEPKEYMGNFLGRSK